MTPIVDGVAGNAVWAVIVRFVLLRVYSVVRRLTKGSPFKSVVLCLRHRINATTRYYDPAFTSGGDVLYIAIMSQSTLKEMPQHLKASQLTNTRLRVLTWHHETPPEAVELFRMHLQENPVHRDRTLDQLRHAVGDWRALEKEYGNLSVREFRSAPTMQGLIVAGKWALVELLPYAAGPHERPALLLTPQSDPEAFTSISAQFERLWNDAERQ